MSEEVIYTTSEVTENEINMRLDKFLSVKLPDFSRSRLQKLISDGFVECEDVVIADNSHKVKLGDIYQISIPPAEEAEPKPQNIALEIVYEDEDIIVVNKQSGMTVHPAAGAHDGTLVNALLFHCKDNLSGIGGVKRPGIVHRIDKETSGLLVAAKNDTAHRFLSEQFAEHSIERTYIAIVYGVPNPLSGRIEASIGRSKFDRKKMAIVESGGKKAVTNYRTLKMFGSSISVVQCSLETGRTHQIRVHLSSRGNALVGDKVYVKNKKSEVRLPIDMKNYVNNFPRQALHAKTLGFIHPRKKEFMQFDSQLPEDMVELIAKLEKNI
ncbi:MAG: RluA family pseudouridine synthase [Alphaproteobacteria bacterium]|nr:RluA family pseudouridine synthase [Alphaproteobacteria bacterium]